MAQTFSWAAAADAGLGLAGGLAAWGSGLNARTIAAANAYAENKIREGQNEVRASNNSLTATLRQISTERILTNASKQLEAMQLNRQRTQDAAGQGLFEADIRAAEQMGAQAAASAASGVGGSAINAASGAALLQQARLRQRLIDQAGQRDYDMVQQMTGVMSGAVAGINRMPLTGGIDYGQSTAGYQPNNALGLIFGGLLSKKDSLNTLLGSFRNNDVTVSPVNMSLPVGQDIGPLSSVAVMPVSSSTVEAVNLGQK